jgi:hypothetical protein
MLSFVLNLSHGGFADLLLLLSLGLKGNAFISTSPYSSVNGYRARENTLVQNH